jgi:hypothetical protein
MVRSLGCLRSGSIGATRVALRADRIDDARHACVAERAEKRVWTRDGAVLRRLSCSHGISWFSVGQKLAVCLGSEQDSPHVVLAVEQHILRDITSRKRLDSTVEIPCGCAQRKDLTSSDRQFHFGPPVERVCRSVETASDEMVARA